MFKLFKFLPLVGLFQDVTEAYNQETGNNRPFYLSRRFIGSLVALGGSFVALQYGITVDTANLTNLSDNITALITAGVTLYGTVLTVYGYFDRR